MNDTLSMPAGVNLGRGLSVGQPTRTDKAPLASVLEHQENVLNSLVDLVANLEIRLHPLMSPPGPEDPNKPLSSAPTSVVQVIDQNNMKILNTNNRLHDILNRLEV